MLVLVDKGLDFSELSVEFAVLVYENFLLLVIIALFFFLERGDFGYELPVGGCEAVTNFLQFINFELQYHFLFGLDVIIKELIDFLVINVMIAMTVTLFLLMSIRLFEWLILLSILNVNITLLWIHDACWWFKYYLVNLAKI